MHNARDTSTESRRTVDGACDTPSKSGRLLHNVYSMASEFWSTLNDAWDMYNSESRSSAQGPHPDALPGSYIPISLQIRHFSDQISIGLPQLVNSLLEFS